MSSKTAEFRGIISTKEARKLLGSKYKDAADEVVERIVLDMATLSASLIDWLNSSTKSKGVL